MLKIGISPSFDVVELARKHVEALNGTIKTGKDKGQPKKYSLSSKLAAAVRTSTGDEKRLLEYLLDGAPVNNLLSGDPSILKSICEVVEADFPTLPMRVNKDDVFTPSSIATKLLSIFDYKAFRQTKYCENLLHSLGYADSTPCVYCNLDMVCIIKYQNLKSGELITQALLDIDHFFSKARFPYLGLSFYNLIPSCHNCNSNLKGSKEFLLETHIHPHILSFNDIFRFCLERPFELSQGVDDITISYTNVLAFPSNSVTDMAIIPRYYANRNEILLTLKGIYKEYKRVGFINDLFGDNDRFNDIFAMSGIPNRLEQITEFRMGKLKRDLLLDLGVII